MGRLDPLAAMIEDERKWLATSLGLALLAAAVLLHRLRRTGVPVRRRVEAAMTLCCGVTIGTMALGHLLAVTTKLASGKLEGSPLVYYAIGVALAAPSWWLTWHTRRLLASDAPPRRTTLGLNACLAATLLALGLHNLPLAAPALLNIAYRLHSRPAVGWVIVSLAVVATAGLFAGSLVFLASGQTFEQFSGTE